MNKFPNSVQNRYCESDVYRSGQEIPLIYGSQELISTL
jgi:hypothetical protein